VFDHKFYPNVLLTRHQVMLPAYIIHMLYDGMVQNVLYMIKLLPPVNPKFCNSDYKTPPVGFILNHFISKEHCDTFHDMPLFYS
jgi:hypothetical protein